MIGILKIHNRIYLQKSDFVNNVHKHIFLIDNPTLYGCSIFNCIPCCDCGTPLDTIDLIIGKGSSSNANNRIAGKAKYLNN